MIDLTGRDGLSVQRSASEILCLNLSKGLHAAAQPLTILRASLDKGRIDGMSMGELHELAASSAVEVERVCSLFSCLKQLVDVDGIRPRLSTTAILPLLADAAEGVNRLFEKDGIFLSSIVVDDCLPVLVDRARTIQALSIVLLIAHELSHAQETIELIVSSPDTKTVRVVVRNLNSNPDAISAEAKLSMALAEANIRSQGASFFWSLKPFGVQIDFQNAPVAATADKGLF